MYGVIYAGEGTATAYGATGAVMYGVYAGAYEITAGPPQKCGSGLASGFGAAAGAACAAAAKHNSNATTADTICNKAIMITCYDLLRIYSTIYITDITEIMYYMYRNDTLTI